MKRLTKDNYTDDLFEKQKELIKIDEYHEIHYSQANYNEDLWNAVKEKEDLQEELGFDLGKLQEINYIYAEDENNILRKYEFIGVNFKEKKIWFWCDFMPMYLSFENYKETFWLKEDRSE